MLPVNINRFVLLLMLFTNAVGCGGVEDPRGQRVAVSGTVTLDGEPLPAGTIRLASNQGNGAVKARAQISDGVFTFSEENGPLSGDVRVEIFSPTMELEQYDAARAGQDSGFEPVFVPPRYNLNSQLTASIEPAGSDQSLTFELKSE